MVIPKRFKLFGHDVEVSWKDDLSDLHGEVGRYLGRVFQIYLQTPTSATSIARTMTEQTYCHELVHAILQNMQEDELSRNEKFVDVFASCLHQILTTGEGELS